MERIIVEILLRSLMKRVDRRCFLGRRQRHQFLVNQFAFIFSFLCRFRQWRLLCGHCLFWNVENVVSPDGNHAEQTDGHQEVTPFVL